MHPPPGPVLVIAPHPDDEVLGLGGTIAKLADQGREVFVVIVTRGDPSMFPSTSIEQTRREALAAHAVLGVTKTIFLEGFPAALLDTVPLSELNAALRDTLRSIEPDVIFLPYYGDLHLDHRKVFESGLVAARPEGTYVPASLYAYETLSETNWGAPLSRSAFAPNTFVDISPSLDRKLKAFRAYETQVRPFPHERSLEAIQALATTRGATVGLEAAEAFVLIRSIRSREAAI
jgi:LmbE family N-acetylglucosaminyl deacetylase